MRTETRQEKLDRLDREILEEQAALSRQAALIAWLAAEGHSTATAEAVLVSIQSGLAMLVAQRVLVSLDGG